MGEKNLSFRNLFVGWRKKIVGLKTICRLEFFLSVEISFFRVKRKYLLVGKKNVSWGKKMSVGKNLSVGILFCWLICFSSVGEKLFVG